MISRLRGTWEPAEFGPGAVIDGSGVGWAVDVIAEHAPGEPVDLWVAAMYRDGEPRFYGFDDALTRQLFTMLTSVQAIGAATAAEVLRTLGPAGLVAAVVGGDHAQVAAARGVGPKTARRIVTDLEIPQAIIDAVGGVVAEDPRAATDDLVDALVAMGWKPAAAEAAVTEARAAHDNEADVLATAMAALVAQGATK